MGADRAILSVARSAERVCVPTGCAVQRQPYSDRICALQITVKKSLTVRGAVGPGKRAHNVRERS